MSTNPRINVTFDNDVAALIASIAKSEDKSMSTIVRELTSEAIELREDRYFSKLAAKLDKKRAKTIPHDEAWK
jgi:mannitol/fructose-specific phosphotransferase system IIA component